MKLLALDFDGVVSDSAPEAFRVALRTWCTLHPESRLGDEIYDAFIEMMPLGNRAEDYAVELASLDAGHVLQSQGEYDAFKAGLDPQELRRFHRRFYKERAHLYEEDAAAWHRLMAPYENFLAMLRRRFGDVELAIATAKDRRSVARLLEAYGVDDLFGAERILDKETGVSKAAHMEHLQRTVGIPYPEITFVDDKLNHLDSVAPLGVRCVLAAWGYNGPREQAAARERGFLVCDLGDVEGKLFA